MGAFILRKAGAALIVVFLASVLVFVGVRAIPGDPALAYAAEDRDPKVLADIREKYGLDDPVPVQYVRWVGLALQGDLGTDTRGLPDAGAHVPRDADRDRDRDHGGSDRRGTPREGLGLRRNLGCPPRPLRAALLARPADDHRLRGQPERAACERLRAVS